MQRQYFREVYMITFLNTDMITKNKRVESYLQSLGKNAGNWSVEFILRVVDGCYETRSLILK